MSEIVISPSYHRARKGDQGLEVDIGQINSDLVDHLQELDGKVAKAVDRAIRKVARWLRTHSMREIGRALGIKQAAIKHRYRFTDTGKGFERKAGIWVGLLAIAAHEAGTPAQNAAGVRVRGHQFDSAFLQKIYGSEEKVYIRASRNRQLKHATVGGHDSWRYRPKSPSFLAEYGDRFPVQVIGVDIESVARPILERYEKRLNDRYREILEQELNYVLNVES